MSASYSVVGFKPPDQKWKDMKKVWDACANAKICVPSEVDNFFDGEEPSSDGVSVSLASIAKNIEEEYLDGYSIELKGLPKDIKIIKFIISY